MFTLGTTAFLLIIVVFVFFTFIFMPNAFPASFTRVAIRWSLGHDSAVNAVSSAYIRLLTFLPPIETPSSGSSDLKIISVNRLKRYGDSTHPCLVSLFILIFFELPFSVLTTASCFQYSRAIILISFPSIPVEFRTSHNFSWLTLSSAFS